MFYSFSLVNLFISEIAHSHQIRKKEQQKDSHLVFFPEIRNDTNEIFFKGNNELTKNLLLCLSWHNVIISREKNGTVLCRWWSLKSQLLKSLGN